MIKIYPAEVIKTLGEHIENAPAREPSYFTHEEALQKLKGQIRDLYLKKNYEPREVAKLLKDGGMKITLREVTELLGDQLKKPVRKVKNTISKA
jgi:hypothetical protein